ASFYAKGKTMEIPYSDFDLVNKQAVDFEALKANGFDVEHFSLIKGGRNSLIL
ncbi:hypothetical protein A2U01_0116667, partial [Trifolium medium]|nr:hypothetical protein [Trifolium medium]